MYAIGSYAVPQIQSVNPDINIDSFTFPANDKEEDNVLNSGVDLQFCVMKETKNKEAVYEVLKFLCEDESIQFYLYEQIAVPCKEGDFTLSSMLDSMQSYIQGGGRAGGGGRRGPGRRPAGGASAGSSTNVFHSRQPGHCPIHFAVS